MDNTKDILGLCRLNIMEDNISGSSAVDRDDTLATLDFKRRQLIGKIADGTEPATAEVMQRHLDAQINNPLPTGVTGIPVDNETECIYVAEWRNGRRYPIGRKDEH